MKTVAQMASSIQRISNQAGLRPAARRLLGGLVAGITASGSLVLSEILRDQVDTKKQLRAAAQRASHALKHDAQFDLLPDAYLALVAPVARPMRFRTLDGSDISKPASRKLEALDVIRDSSAKPRDRVAVGPQGVHPRRSAPPARSGQRARNQRKQKRSPCGRKQASTTQRIPRPRTEQRSAARKEERKERIKYPSGPALKKLGYWMIQVETGDGRGNHLPLFSDIFSTQDPAFQALGPKAWSVTFQNAVERVLAQVGTSGVWLADRGFDDTAWMDWMHKRVDQYVIRLKADRRLRPGTKHTPALKVGAFAACLRTPYTATVRYVNKSSHREQSREVTFGWAPVWTDNVEHPQYVIVVHTGRKKPLLLITDRRPESDKEVASVIGAYFERWGSEEVTRVEKQLTGLEGVRVRSLRAIRRLRWLAMIAVGIQALMTLTCPKLREAVLSRAKEFIRTVRFILYRIWRVVQKDVLRAIERRSVLLRL